MLRNLILKNFSLRLISHSVIIFCVHRKRKDGSVLLIIAIRNSILVSLSGTAKRRSAVATYKSFSFSPENNNYNHIIEWCHLRGNFSSPQEDLSSPELVTEETNGFGGLVSERGSLACGLCRI